MLSTLDARDDVVVSDVHALAHDKGCDAILQSFMQHFCNGSVSANTTDFLQSLFLFTSKAKTPTYASVARLDTSRNNG
ncbi:hypothetical protein BN2476_160043 [Paraburkholderia piptadeniae]|uniref:Uncharacterized protein n=1 Tax=Paraburkholderia piptadeniae TaxID=1701573 RepID=A0A1N7RSS0_9BURK|nr:hypothetical protein BN2476_160043 [Paraburkholderia piptadeniae]